jgi:hypothetical protein
MNFYYLTLILILVSIALGQLAECNATNNTSSINDSSSMAFAQLQELHKTNTSAQYSDSIDLDFQVLEANGNTSARFGVGKKEAAKQEMYKISIINKNDIRIADVIVSAEMAEDMKFESTRYYEENRGRLDVTRDPPDFKKGTRTKLIWDIGALEPEEIKSILLEAYIKPGVNNTNVTVGVTGIVNADIVEYVSASKDNANITECKHSNKFTGNNCDDASDTENCERIQCPDWSIPQ